MAGVLDQVKKMFRAVGCGARVWSRRLRQLQYWRLGLFFGALAAVSVLTAHIESFSLSMSEDMLNGACGESLGDLFVCMTGILGVITVTLSVRLGVLVVVALVVYAYTFALKGISTYLPWYLSLVITGGIAVLGHFHQPMNDLIVGAVTHIYPPILRDDFSMMARWATPAASALMKIFTISLAVLQVYVTGRIALGVFRRGDLYRESEFFLRWSEDAEPVPGMREVLVEGARRYRLAGVLRRFNGLRRNGGIRSEEPRNNAERGPKDHLRATDDALARRRRNAAKRQRRKTNKRARRARRGAR